MMKHLPFNETKITKLYYYSNLLNVELFCKRDDLFEDALGGSKVRMLKYILADVTPDKFDVFLTAGRPCSNFNRACAILCVQQNIPMHLVEYTDVEEEWSSINYFFCKLSGVITTRCEKKDVPETISSVISEYFKSGKRVKYVWGGGRSIEGIYAYYDAVKEMRNQIGNVDYVFLACGTGTTFSGISAGMQDFFPNAVVYGISVAHDWKFMESVLKDDLSMLSNYNNKDYSMRNMVFTTDYLCGDYGMYCDDLIYEIKRCLSKEGMIIDQTYSGKAFWGMIDIIKNNPDVFKNKKVLFLNTGGFINLISDRNLICR